jgi:hypothetical protein
MTDKIDILNKRDLEIVLEVNKKSILIEMEVASQNEEIIKELEASEIRDDEILKQVETLNETVDIIKKISEENSKDIYKIQILFLTGLLSLIIQIIQILKK